MASSIATTFDDEETIKSTLLQWASENLLNEASLSDDGSTLSLRGSVLKNIDITVQHGGKSCRYSLASIYLQILDPNQGLMAYRNACKKYNCEPIKALDKPTAVGFFLGTSLTTTTTIEQQQQADSSAATAPTAVAVSSDASAATTAAAAEVAAAGPSEEGAPAAESVAAAVLEEEKSPKSDRKHRKEKDSHEHHRSHSHRHGGKDKDHHKRKHHRDDKSPNKKKKKGLVTNEQLFSNLSNVVDKRQLEQQAQEEITIALSAEGFQVTAEILSEHKEKTQAILANEIPVGNSASILRATNPKKNLARVLELYLETVNPPKNKAKPGSGGRPSSSSSGATVSSKPVRTHLIGKKPVLIVPKGMTAPLTIINAHEFFCNGRFVPRDVMLKQGSGQHRSPATTFTRKVRVGSSGSTGLLEYEIMDNPKKLGNNPKDWERIVSVIVLGQVWQFKDWPAPYNNPVQLFSQTYGFYVSMEGDKIPNEIGSWAVKQARLNRDKRGLDSVTHASFWNGLDEFMAVHRPELLPQQEI